VPIWICDTSPICYFARLGLLHILPNMLGQLVVPQAVVNEIDTGRAQHPNLPDLRLLNWVHITQPPSTPPEISRHQLGPGETEAIALAHSLSDTCILLDDFQARQEATEKGIPVRGTLALLLMAKERNLVQEVGPLIDQLDALGFRVSDAVRETILEIAGET